jgi:hypothetical protein
LTAKPASHLAKDGMLGLLYVNVARIIADLSLLETLKICKWLLKQDH